MISALPLNPPTESISETHKNSLIALSELRSAKNRKLQEKSQCEEIKRQLVTISQLQERKKMLTSRLVLLSQGNTPADIDAGAETRIKALYSNLWNLQEKLAAYRIIGPCGITVLDKSSEHLVVSFTSMWHSITESFCLRIKFSEGELKVSGTTIPYFIDVQSLLNHSKHLTLSQQMDTIGHHINAYIRRKGELEYVKSELKRFVAVCEADESVTNVQLTLNKDGHPNNKLFIFMVYPSIDALFPETVRISPENLDISESVMTDLSRELEVHPLSVAISTLVPILT